MWFAYLNYAFQNGENATGWNLKLSSVANVLLRETLF